MGRGGSTAQGRRAQRDPDRRAADPVTPATRTLRLTLAYDGTGLHGWQIQPDRLTVQGLLAEACARILGTPPTIVGASRTDAGVHALRQVASLRTASPIGPAVLARALNALLPPAVRVLEAREAPPGFSARRAARGKRYAYLIDRSPVADPFLRHFAWRVPYALDAAAMVKALASLRGTHDFSAFCAAPGRGRTPRCTLRSARIVTQGTRLAVLLSADSFLHHMVRNIVGSLVEVGRGARQPEWMAEVLASRNRALAGPTAPARGLVLLRVMYGGDG
ncbi:MAG TPA: tRNA pseudouridine(38-40) synthase TruA [Methylomirabilota bacterium]|nr:tRNA pseudouridine(38-40) synthase TruA [Methylomirabilota bacterium]